MTQEQLETALDGLIAEAEKYLEVDEIVSALELAAISLKERDE